MAFENGPLSLDHRSLGLHRIRGGTHSGAVRKRRQEKREHYGFSVLGRRREWFGPPADSGDLLLDRWLFYVDLVLRVPYRCRPLLLFLSEGPATREVGYFASDDDLGLGLLLRSLHMAAKYANAGGPNFQGIEGNRNRIRNREEIIGDTDKLHTEETNGLERGGRARR
jgi:hypothetical protein